jgi:hypothetical protein
MPELILYTSEDGQTSIRLRAEDGTVWLSQQEMAELFATSIPNTNQHVRKILADGEQTEATIKSCLIVQNEGSRSVRRKTMSMANWAGRLNAFHGFNEHEYSAMPASCTPCKKSAMTARAGQQETDRWR